MKDISVIKLTVPGDWRDAWIYKDHVLLWSRDQNMYYIPLDNIRRNIARTAKNGELMLANYMIFRNDWKADQRFKEMLKVPSMKKGILESFPHGSSGFEIELTAEPQLVRASEPIGYVYDTCIYANRIYHASSEGAFLSILNVNEPELTTGVTQALDYETTAVSAKYSCVNFSAGDEGLWFSRVYFEDYLDEKNNSYQNVAEYSTHTSFAGRNLLNYSESRHPTLLKANDTKETIHSNARYTSYVVTGFSGAFDISSIVNKATQTKNKVAIDNRENIENRTSETDVEHQTEVLGNSNYRLLVEDKQGLSVVNLASFAKNKASAQRNEKFNFSTENTVHGSDILSTNPIGSGFAVELFDEIQIFTEEGSFTVHKEPAGRIRTFSDSRRHKDVIISCGENSASIIGFLEI